MNNHEPDEFLMRKIRKELARCPMSVGVLAETLSRHRSQIEAAIKALQAQSKVELHRGGHCWQLTQSGPVPPEAA